MQTRHVLTALLAGALAFLCAAPSHAKVVIAIDKASQRMTVSVDGEPRYTWPVSTGRGRYVTPSGTFKPFRMEVDHYSKEWDDAPMPHSIFFTKIGHAIHGSFETKRLGRPASHGCVRLAPANAATLFALVKAKGMSATTVMITGHNPDQPVARRRPPAERAAAQAAPAAPEGPPPYGRPYYGQPYDPRPYYGPPPYAQPYGGPYQQPPYAPYRPFSPY
jgi:hypothetical protein